MIFTLNAFVYVAAAAAATTTTTITITTRVTIPSTKHLFLKKIVKRNDTRLSIEKH